MHGLFERLMLHAPSGAADQALRSRPDEFITAGFVPVNASTEALTAFAKLSVKAATVAYKASVNGEFLAQAARTEKRKTVLPHLWSAHFATKDDFLALVDTWAGKQFDTRTVVKQSAEWIVSAWEHQPKLAGNLGRDSFTWALAKADADPQVAVRALHIITAQRLTAQAIRRSRSHRSRLISVEQMMNEAASVTQDPEDAETYALDALEGWLCPDGDEISPVWLTAEEALLVFDRAQSVSRFQVRLSNDCFVRLADERGWDGLAWALTMLDKDIRYLVGFPNVLEKAVSGADLSVPEVRWELRRTLQKLTLDNGKPRVLPAPVDRTTEVFLRYCADNNLMGETAEMKVSDRLLTVMASEYPIEVFTPLLEQFEDALSYRSYPASVVDDHNLDAYVAATVLPLVKLAEAVRCNLSLIALLHAERLGAEEELLDSEQFWNVLMGLAERGTYSFAKDIEATVVILSG